MWTVSSFLHSLYSVYVVSTCICYAYKYKSLVYRLHLFTSCTGTHAIHQNYFTTCICNRKSGIMNVIKYYSSIIYHLKGIVSVSEFFWCTYSFHCLNFKTVNIWLAFALPGSCGCPIRSGGAWQHEVAVGILLEQQSW